MIRILAFADRYLPGYRAGGPIRSLGNLVERLGDEFEFRVVTRDRDSGDSSPYSGITDTWQPLGKAMVLYLNPEMLTWGRLRHVLRHTEYDLLYLNSFFSPTFTVKTLLMRRLEAIPRKPIILAPRGEFSDRALNLKSPRKKAFLKVAKALRLYDDVLWQASSSFEEQDIRRWFGSKLPIVIAPNLGANELIETAGPTVTKHPGILRLISISRVSRMKNLDGALRLLVNLRGTVSFDIYGPIEDSVYWDKCQTIIGSLPKNVRVSYRGQLEHDQVHEALRSCHILFMPTLGENFGHVILEAFQAGCPVLVSDQTPWRDLKQKQVGWDLPLERLDLFQNVLHAAVEMDNDQFQAWSKSALEFGKAHYANAESLQQHRKLFAIATARSLSAPSLKVA